VLMLLAAGLAGIAGATKRRRCRLGDSEALALWGGAEGAFPSAPSYVRKVVKWWRWSSSPMVSGRNVRSLLAMESSESKKDPQQDQQVHHQEDAVDPGKGGAFESIFVCETHSSSVAL